VRERQKTIREAVSYTGTALHSGEETTVVFKPSPPDTGVRFVRVDLPDKPAIRVCPENARYDPSAGRRTILSNGAAEVHTVEHLLACVMGLGIDNIEIDVNGQEAGVLFDGSALHFVKLLDSAGRVEQEAPKRYFKVTRSLSYRQDHVELHAVPNDGLRVSFTIQYDNPNVGTQHASFDLNPDVFTRDVAPARTFVLFKDVDALRQKGMIRGGSIDNAVVVKEDGIMNEEPLRFSDEFVRHKILDLIGDLGLLGRPVRGHIIAVRSGHEANVAFIRMLHEEEAGRKPRGPRPSEREGAVWDIGAIQEIMPHRYPFLLVDRIVELHEGERVVGTKNVTINEPFFVGHFPGHPIMPAVLIIEAMAQCGGVLLLNTVDNPEDKLVYFMGIDNAKFRKPVLPGDQLRFELEMVRLKGRICKMRGRAYVDGELVSEADLLSTIVDR
jgi:UDP-3-O-[3-hydroxymyristoyl] N-acetylglucosamine deacetylase/3-hydroxyacyl-[acyl-carrier-protein] dehydratase